MAPSLSTLRTELEKWKSLAMQWEFILTETAWECGDCGAVIHYLFDPQGIRYSISDTELSTLKIAHLRSRHERVLPREI